MLMFVHISPEPDAVGETISTLKFAERVASVELGAAKANKESGEIRDLKEQVSAYFLLLISIKKVIGELKLRFISDVIFAHFRLLALRLHWLRRKENRKTF